MQTAEDFEIMMEGLLSTIFPNTDEMKLRNSIIQYQEYLRMGITNIKEAGEYEKHKIAKVILNILDQANKTFNLSQLDKPVVKRSLSVLSDTPPSAPARHHPLSQSAMTPLSGLQSLNTQLTVPTLNTRKSVNPLDMTHTDGADLLSESETILCSNLRLFPHAYMAIKDTILKEYAAKGIIKRRAIRSLIKIDVNKTSRIFDYFLEMGWIKNRAE